MECIIYNVLVIGMKKRLNNFLSRIFTELCTLDYTKISAAPDLSHFLIEISRSQFYSHNF